VCGGPGHGKTTLGAHFLRAGHQAGEACLFISLSERPKQLIADMKLRGIDLSGIEVLDLRPRSGDLAQTPSTYSIFDPGASQGPSVTKKIVETVERLKPTRVFLDSLTHIRYLNSDALAYRKQTAALLSYLHEQGCTVLGTAEASRENPDEDLQYLCDGIIALQREPERCIKVTKFRGSAFEDGEHGLRLTDRGMEIYPRLVPGGHDKDFPFELYPSGVPRLDKLLNGGFERGTVSILTGPSGVGKTTLAFQFMKEAAGRGDRSVAYVFEERLSILKKRCESVGMPLSRMEQSGTLAIERVEPLRYAPDEFAARVRAEVEENDARIVMIDSVAGYRLSMRGRSLEAPLFALTKYLQNVGVTVLLTNEVEAVTGEFSATGAGLSYMADTVVFLRYLELRGELIKAIGVLKKRLSDFEKSMRRLEIGRFGIEVGEPLSHLRGILTGVPEWDPSQ